MGRHTKGYPSDPSVSASELAQMGRCERLVVFEHMHGPRQTYRQQRDRKRGLLAHEQFKHEGLDSMSVAAPWRGRCFIATCMFGDNWQTRILRRFRDEVSRPRALGRWLIRRYYLAGPGLCVVLRKRPVLRGAAQAALGLMATVLRWWFVRRGGDK